MYYYVNAHTGQIVESTDKAPSQDDLQSEANYMDCPLYVIEGQHYGMTAEPELESEDEEK